MNAPIEETQTPEGNASLTITITRCKENSTIYIALYDSRASFLQIEQAVGKKVVKPQDGTAVVTFTGLSAKEYAFAFFQDENDNGKLDKNILGIPTEHYGFSNNARGTFGAPDYTQCKFKLQAGENKASARLN